MEIDAITVVAKIAGARGTFLTTWRGGERPALTVPRRGWPDWARARDPTDHYRQPRELSDPMSRAAAAYRPSVIPVDVVRVADRIAEKCDRAFSVRSPCRQAVQARPRRASDRP
jgi:hypothetical protein